jgi:hypothetical protein
MVNLLRAGDQSMKRLRHNPYVPASRTKLVAVISLSSEFRLKLMTAPVLL